MCQREEEERKEEERKRTAEERRRLEKERILKERRDAEERDRKMDEKLRMIEEQRFAIHPSIVHQYCPPVAVSLQIRRTFFLHKDQQ